MSRDDEGFVLHAFLGERDPITRLAGSLTGTTLVELGLGLCMAPITPQVRQDANIQENNQKAAPAWPFRSIEAPTAARYALLAGTGRIAYVEAWGYKDSGAEISVGWQDGEIRSGPTNAPWYSNEGGSIDQIAAFLGVPFHERDVFRRRLLKVAKHLDAFLAAAEEGHQPFRRRT